MKIDRHGNCSVSSSEVVAHENWNRNGRALLARIAANYLARNDCGYWWCRLCDFEFPTKELEMHSVGCPVHDVKKLLEKSSCKEA